MVNKKGNREVDAHDYNAGDYNAAPTFPVELVVCKLTGFGIGST